MEPASSEVRDKNLPPVSQPEVRAFWTGPRLSPYEELSLRSFLAAGARVVLYSTDTNLRVPSGVELADVRDILPSYIHQFTFADGVRSPALHSDLFRYLAVNQFGGWYTDLDIIVVGAELPRSKVYIARESDKLINGAVMKFPAGSPFLTAAIEEAWRLLPTAAPGASLSKRLVIGPELVTLLIKDYALDHVVLPRSCAYEISCDEIPAMFDPGLREELDERTANSDFIHLWNEIWRWVRIPKDYGPPVGSFLDGLFRRFGIDFADEARLSAETIAIWFQERHALNQMRWRLGSELLPPNALDLLIKRNRGKRPPPASPPSSQSQASMPARPVRTANVPQVVRTFWHGGMIRPFQLVCLRSFVDRGHQVEVFSYESIPGLPEWLMLKDAADVMPLERIVRHFPEQRRSAIRAGLFRHALLHRFGGWWIDPDVVLLRTELPAAHSFFSGPTEFNGVSTAAMKFPTGHAVLTEALIHSTPFEDSITDWEKADATLLTQSLASSGLLGSRQSCASVSPLSWFEVIRLFNPDQADSLAKQFNGKYFLDLHYEVWLGAGIPAFLAPPRGSFLDKLFEKHDVSLEFPARMEFDDVKRWMTHMYDSLHVRGDAAS